MATAERSGKAPRYVPTRKGPFTFERKVRIPREAALRRIDAQKSDRYYIDNCGLILRNDGDVGAFEKEFEEALKETQHG